MKFKRQSKKSNILQIRSDIYVNINNIDTIVRTSIDPKTNEKLPHDIYVIYFRDAHFNWVSCGIDDFNKLIKPYI